MAQQHDCPAKRTGGQFGQPHQPCGPKEKKPDRSPKTDRTSDGDETNTPHLGQRKGPRQVYCSADYLEERMKAMNVNHTYQLYSDHSQEPRKVRKHLAACIATQVSSLYTLSATQRDVTQPSMLYHPFKLVVKLRSPKVFIYLALPYLPALTLVSRYLLWCDAMLAIKMHSRSRMQA